MLVRSCFVAVALNMMVPSTAAAPCTMSGTWSASWVRHHFPPSKGSYAMKQTSASTWTVDDSSMGWKHGDGAIDEEGQVTVKFTDKPISLTGHVVSGSDGACQKIFWSNKSIWCNTPAGDKHCGEEPTVPGNIKKVHMVCFSVFSELACGRSALKSSLSLSLRAL